MAELEEHVTLTELVKIAYKQAKEKGFHDKDGTPEAPTFGDRIALIHSEASEALEAFRQRGLVSWYVASRPDGGKEEFSTATVSVCGTGVKPEGVASELADIVIRVADLCGTEGINLERAIEKKLAYNSTRTYMHGGKKL